MAFLIFHKSTYTMQVFSTQNTEGDVNQAAEYLYDTYISK